MKINKLLGTTFIVAGTTIGGGMLAMPLSTAELGFQYTVLLMIILWLFLVYAGLLLVELHQNFPTDFSFARITEHYLGPIGRIFTDVGFFLFMFAVIAAYIIGGGNLIGSYLPIFEYSQQVYMILFTCALGSFVFFGARSVDIANRFFFIIKMTFFLALFILFIFHVKLSNLSAIPSNKLYMLSATPILFTSFAFHVVIPSLVNYLDNDIRSLKLSIWFGSGIAFIVYLLWQISMQGVLEQQQFLAILADNPNLNAIIEATKKITHSSKLEYVTLSFTSTAVLTSFLGVSLALCDGVRDLLKKVNLHKSRIIVILATYTPSIIIAIFYPAGFALILGYAGILLAILQVVLPIILVFLARRKYPDNKYKVCGGNIALLIMMIGILTVITVPLLIKLSILPAVFA